MKISLVIPAFNEERLLGDSLREIRRAMAAFTSSRVRNMSPFQEKNRSSSAVPRLVTLHK